MMDLSPAATDAEFYSSDMELSPLNTSLVYYTDWGITHLKNEACRLVSENQS